MKWDEEVMGGRGGGGRDWERVLCLERDGEMCGGGVIDDIGRMMGGGLEM